MVCFYMAKKRTAKILRKTGETKVCVEVNLDGAGKYCIETGIGFFNHMLELFSKHSMIDLKLNAVGDLEVDQHHTVEDVGIALGQAMAKALGNKGGISRYGWEFVPMDESLGFCALDLSGRSRLVFEAKFSEKKAGGLSTELVEDFFQAVCSELKANIHLKIMHGRNTHHKIEALFKAFARALRFAVSMDKRQSAGKIPSTKGIL